MKKTRFNDDKTIIDLSDIEEESVTPTFAKAMVSQNNAERNQNSAERNQHNAEGNPNNAERNQHNAEGNPNNAERNQHNAERNQDNAERNQNLTPLLRKQERAVQTTKNVFEAPAKSNTQKNFPPKGDKASYDIPKVFAETENRPPGVHVLYKTLNSSVDANNTKGAVRTQRRRNMHVPFPEKDNVCPSYSRNFKGNVIWVFFYIIVILMGFYVYHQLSNIKGTDELYLENIKRQISRNAQTSQRQKRSPSPIVELMNKYDQNKCNVSFENKFCKGIMEELDKLHNSLHNDINESFKTIDSIKEQKRINDEMLEAEENHLIFNERANTPDPSLFVTEISSKGVLQIDHNFSENPENADDPKLHGKQPEERQIDDANKKMTKHNNNHLFFLIDQLEKQKGGSKTKKTEISNESDRLPQHETSSVSSKRIATRFDDQIISSPKTNSIDDINLHGTVTSESMKAASQIIHSSQPNGVPICYMPVTNPSLVKMPSSFEGSVFPFTSSEASLSHSIILPRANEFPGFGMSPVSVPVYPPQMFYNYPSQMPPYQTNPYSYGVTGNQPIFFIPPGGQLPPQPLPYKCNYVYNLMPQQAAYNQPSEYRTTTANELTEDPHEEVSSGLRDNEFPSNIIYGNHTIPDSRSANCLKGEKGCADGSCIPKRHWCDGIVHCEDSSDEMRCSCKSRIDPSRLCDGFYDCPVGEDEMGCFNCPPSHFSCNEWSRASKHSSCFSMRQRCDGTAECRSGLDESDCTMLHETLDNHKPSVIPHTVGFLHKNYRGNWYPSCDMLNPYKWAYSACALELGELESQPLIQIVAKPSTYSGKFIQETSEGRTVFTNNCLNGSAVYVVCPQMKCGTRSKPSLQSLRTKNLDKDELYDRLKRQLHHAPTYSMETVRVVNNYETPNLYPHQSVEGHPSIRDYYHVDYADDIIHGVPEDYNDFNDYTIIDSPVIPIPITDERLLPHFDIPQNVYGDVVFDTPEGKLISHFPADEILEPQSSQTNFVYQPPGEFPPAEYFVGSSNEFEDSLSAPFKGNEEKQDKFDQKPIVDHSKIADGDNNLSQGVKNDEIQIDKTLEQELLSVADFDDSTIFSDSDNFILDKSRTVERNDENNNNIDVIKNHHSNLSANKTQTPINKSSGHNEDMTKKPFKNDTFDPTHKPKKNDTINGTQMRSATETNKEEIVGIVNEIMDDDDDNQERVVGGQLSQPAAWPSLVAIYKDGTLLCSGTIISHDWILTAAHCTIGSEKHYFEIQAGMLRRLSFSPQEQVRTVSKIFTHGKYDRKNMHNDIAMMQLKKPLILNRWVRPACLPSQSSAGPGWIWEPTAGTLCTAVGWGATSEHGPDPDHVREVQIPIVATCKSAMDRTGNEICAGYPEGGKDACQGDSGGPFLCKNPINPSQWYVAGVVSHGDGCARPNEYGAYTRVSLYKDWIHKTMTDKKTPHIVPKQTCIGFSCIWGVPKCLPKSKHCDFIVDCLGGEDEMNCYEKHAFANLLRNAEKQPDGDLGSGDDSEEWLSWDSKLDIDRLDNHTSKFRSNDEVMELERAASDERENNTANGNSTFLSKNNLNLSKNVSNSSRNETISNAPTKTKNDSFIVETKELVISNNKSFVNDTNNFNVGENNKNQSKAINDNGFMAKVNETATEENTNAPFMAADQKNGTFDHLENNNHQLMPNRSQKSLDEINASNDFEDTNSFMVSPTESSNAKPSSGQSEPSESDVQNEPWKPNEPEIPWKPNEPIESEKPNEAIESLKPNEPLESDKQNEPIESREPIESMDFNKPGDTNEFNGPFQPNENFNEDFTDTPFVAPATLHLNVSPLHIDLNPAESKSDEESIIFPNKIDESSFDSDAQQFSENQVSDSTISKKDLNQNGQIETPPVDQFEDDEELQKLNNFISTILPATPVVMPPLLPFFSCKRLNQTIPMHKRCNRLPDCEDGSDEWGCICPDYLMVDHPNMLCDGYVDCADGSDESNCDPCPENHFHCTISKSCIPFNQVCDERKDCVMGEDEMDCFALCQNNKVTLDRDLRPHLNFEGVLSMQREGMWRPVCEETWTPSKMESTADNICKYLGFGGFETFNAGQFKHGGRFEFTQQISPRQVDAAEVLKKNLRASPANEIIMPIPDNLNCLALYVRCLQAVVTNVSNHIIPNSFLGGAYPQNEVENEIQDIYLWPWVAKLYSDGRYTCSGVLVHYLWVLVENTCRDALGLGLQYVNAVLGSKRSIPDIDGPYEQIIPVAGVRSIDFNGISLLLLEEPAYMSRYVRPVAMPDLKVHELLQDDVCIVTGIDQYGNSTSVFLEPLDTYCGFKSRCFRRKLLDGECQNPFFQPSQSLAAWSGIVVCHRSHGWYPAASFREPLGPCGFQGKLALPDLTFVKQDIDLYIASDRLPEKLAPRPCDGVRCRLGQCVPRRQICDGVMNCRDGLDETPESCGVKRHFCFMYPLHFDCNCAASLLKCRNGQCIPKTLFANGVDNCGDNSDEPSPPSCFNYLQMSSPEKICDGISHCRDKADEDPVYCQCSARNTFRCPNSKLCVPLDYVCDGQGDCPGNTDEMECSALMAFTKSGEKSGSGEVMDRRFGIWHTRCFEKSNYSKSEVEDICRGLGYTNGHAALMVMPRSYYRAPITKVVVDDYTDVVFRNAVISMRNADTPLASEMVLNEDNKKCHRIFIECGLF